LRGKVFWNFWPRTSSGCGISAFPAGITVQIETGFKFAKRFFYQHVLIGSLRLKELMMRLQTMISLTEVL